MHLVPSSSTAHASQHTGNSITPIPPASPRLPQHHPDPPSITLIPPASPAGPLVTHPELRSAFPSTWVPSAHFVLTGLP